MTISRTAKTLPILFSGCAAYSFLFFTPSPVRATTPDNYLGSTNCQTSGCHGGAGDMSRQYTIWFRADSHSRAYTTLTTARSLRMAESLQIANPANSQRCTGCHAPFASIPASQHSKEAGPEEGVSCETCHGAAGSWIRSHTRPDYTRVQRVGSGMRDLENLYLRANTCVACHQILPPDLIQAGHPKLHFDLATLSQKQPAHWKEIWGQAQLWTVGQFSSLRELSGTLSQQDNPGAYEKADWESSLRICRLILESIPLPTELKNPLPGTTPDKAFTQKCDLLAKQCAGQKWKTEWNHLLLLTFSRHLNQLSESKTDPVYFHLRLKKMASGLRVLTRELDPETRRILEPSLQKLTGLQTLSPDLASHQLPSISQALLAALESKP